MHPPVSLRTTPTGAAPRTAVAQTRVALAIVASMFGVGCGQTQKATQGTVESRLTNPMADMTDTSGRGIAAQTQPTRTARTGGLKVALPQADTSTFGREAPTPAARGGTSTSDTTSSGGSASGTHRITTDDLPYAGPAPARLERSAAGSDSSSDTPEPREPFPKSDFQKRQEAQLARALPERAPRVLSSDSEGAVGVDLVSASPPAAGVKRASTETPGVLSSTSTGSSTSPSQVRPWGIVLATFSGDDSRSVADAVAAQYRERYPQLPDIHVRSKPSGSVVLAGRFEKPGDADAQALLATVKDMQAEGKKLFPKAMFTMMSGVVDGERIAPYDIRQLRLQYPDADPLYSLQVAVWSDLDSGTLDPTEIRRRAEAMCAELRAQGQLAFFSHSDQTRTSVVTVGMFGADAYDPRSTLFSDDVMALLKIFPKHLVNGEELLVSIDPRDPGKLVPQAPRLVEVPR